MGLGVSGSRSIYRNQIGKSEAAATALNPSSNPIVTINVGSIVATRASTNECQFIGPFITAEPDPAGMFTNLLGSIGFPTYT